MQLTVKHAIKYKTCTRDLSIYVLSCQTRHIHGTCSREYTQVPHCQAWQQ